MKEKYWDRFARTGRVEDYLYYKGMDICSQVIERHAEKDISGDAHRAEQTGGRISESDYGDRYGAARISYR